MKYFVLLSILVLLALLIKTRIKPSLLFFSLLITFYMLNLIETNDFLINFVNSSLMTLILLLVVASVLERTDFIDGLSKVFFEKKSLRHSVFRISIITSLLSAFLNNTAVVSTFLGAVKNNKHYYPSKLLIPLSYAAIIGGTITLIGTSTNLIVNGLAISEGLAPLNMFEFTYVGLPIVVFGVVYLTIFSSGILPEYKIQKGKKPLAYFLEAKVLQGSSLINKTIIDNKLRNLDNIFLVEILRDNRLISPVSPNEIIKVNDILIFAGDIAELKDLERFDKLRIFQDKNSILGENLIEVIISHRSDLIGKRIKSVNFRSKFSAGVVAVRRGNKKLSGKIGLIKLEPGDDLILAVGRDFEKKEDLYKDFYMVNPLNLTRLIIGKKSIAAVALFFFAIFMNVFGIISLFKVLLMVLFLFLVLKFTTFQEIKQQINYDLILLIGSAIGISKVMISSGASQEIADFIINIFSGFGVYGSFIGIYILTLLLTEIITNNAAAAVAFPMAYSMAISMSVNPLPFIMAVAYGASASFLTPHGYQTNIIVYSAGGYKYWDYFKTGLPLSMGYSFLVLVLIPYFFNF